MGLPTTEFPARLHVLLAREAPYGLVIRRGPTKQVATILWDRRCDEFRLGQWLKGKIYERRCDISPDGNHLIYFAMNGKWHSEARGSWTAISRVPYLKALAIFPKGDCWHGGGLWVSNLAYWLNDGRGHTVLQDTSEVVRDELFRPPEDFGGECPGVYYPRLLRDGWRLVEQQHVAKWKDKHVFDRTLEHGWLLRKIAHAEVGAPVGRGPYWDEHQLIHSESDAVVGCPDWEWADLDGERLVWTSRGRLFCGALSPAGLADETELFDFRPMVFEPIEAPY